MSSHRDADWQPKAVLFDLLTGLLDSWTTWTAAVEAVTSNPETSSDHSRAWRERYLQLTYGCGAYVPYESLVTRAAVEVGLPGQVTTQLVQRWETLEAWPEVKGVLEKLRAKGYKLGVVTNCSQELGEKAVKRVGVKFDAWISAEESGFYKPRKEAYQAGIDALGVNAEDILFVAGSSGDVVGAAVAGMQVVWNNHIGLEGKPGASPLREGKSLDAALAGFL